MHDDSWDISLRAALARLQAEHGSTWMVWYVPTWDGYRQGITWCARRLADGRLLHAYQPRHLAEYIAAADSPP